MIRKEIVCDTCHCVVQSASGEINHPFVAYEFASQRRPHEFRIGARETCARHVCGDCLSAFAELRNLTKTTGLETANRKPNGA